MNFCTNEITKLSFNLTGDIFHLGYVEQHDWSSKYLDYSHNILDKFTRVFLTELILPYLGNLWYVTKKHHWLSWSWLECQYCRIWLGLMLEEDISKLDILMSTNQTFMLGSSFSKCSKVNNWTWIFSFLNLTIEYYWSFFYILIDMWNRI